MAKRVFLSSVFRTLATVRQVVHDRLINIGYDVWWAEDHPQLRYLLNDLVRAARPESSQDRLTESKPRRN